MRFDWYSATIDAPPSEVKQALVQHLGERARSARGRFGFDFQSEIWDSQQVVARLMFGGRQDHPHAWASGPSTPEFVRVVRSLWPEKHYVTRLDSAVDWNAEDAWEKLSAKCLAVAAEKDLKVSQAGDYFRKVEGRTLYIGSLKSAVFARLYEKGKQMRGRVISPLERESLSPHWVRLEVQVRPVEKGRYRAALVTPEEVWGFSRMSAALLETCAEIKVPHLEQREKQSTNDERAFDAMCKQYGKIITRTVERVGTWGNLGERIGARINALVEPEPAP